MTNNVGKENPMTPQTICTSLTISKRIKELGFERKCLFYWVGNEIWDKTMQSDYENPLTISRDYWIPAYTVGELGEILKEYDNGMWITWWNEKTKYTQARWEAGFYKGDYEGGIEKEDFENADTEANARGLMLIHLLEQKIIEKGQ